MDHSTLNITEPDYQGATAPWRPGTIGQARGPAAVPVGAAGVPPWGPQPKPRSQPQPAAAAASPFTGPQQAALHGEIAASLFRMLQGKLVGRDLLDPAGQLLAAEGAPITDELAVRAEQAGLLPDLVLHMAWPPGSGS